VAAAQPRWKLCPRSSRHGGARWSSIAGVGELKRIRRMSGGGRRREDKMCWWVPRLGRGHTSRNHAGGCGRSILRGRLSIFHKVKRKPCY
jgi:hypothetical protein